MRFSLSILFFVFLASCSSPVTEELTINAGTDQGIYLGQTVRLTATGSFKNTTLQWHISQKPTSSKIALSNHQKASLQFVPDVMGIYTLEVQASSATSKISDSVKVQVTKNQLPQIELSDQQTLLGNTVILQAQVTDPENAKLSFQWSLKIKPANSTFNLVNTSSATLSVQPDVAGIFELSLLVTDEINSVNRTLKLEVKDADTPNQPPVAEAGNNQTLKVGSQATLSGLATDADSDTLEVAWTFTSRPAGSVAQLEEASTLNAHFIADQVGLYQLELSVSDGLETVSDSLTIEAINENAAPVLSPISDQSILKDSFIDIPFTVTDEAPDDLEFTALSTNAALLPNNRITISGTGINRKLTLTPLSQTGQTTITLTARDSENQQSQIGFLLQVTSAFDSPPVSIFSNSKAANDFGESVALDAGMSLIGAPKADQKALDAGAVYAYKDNTQIQILTADDGATGDQFGVSVDIEGNTAIVGAASGNGKSANTGAVYIYTFNGSSWQQTQKLFAEDGLPNDQFGFAVSLSGRFLVIGAYQHSGRGAGYIFQKIGSAWSFFKKLAPTGTNSNDRFGRSLFIRENDLMIGATNDATQGTASGAVYVYSWNNTDWIFRQKLIASGGKPEDRFGRSISLEDNVAVIGAVYDNSFGEQAGSAYIFQRQAGNWTQQQRLLASDAQAEARFGHSVAISNGYVAIGAPGSVTVTSAIYLFETISGKWQQSKKLTAPAQTYTNIGYNMSFYEDTIMTGASYYSTAQSRGAAFLFRK